jgi:hypothetical protein
MPELMRKRCKRMNKLKRFAASRAQNSSRRRAALASEPSASRGDRTVGALARWLIQAPLTHATRKLLAGAWNQHDPMSVIRRAGDGRSLNVGV